jgi:glycosyltransferase involved in cell wall biosynthesis
VLGGAGFYYPAPEPQAIAAALARLREDIRDGRAAESVRAGRLRAEREFSVTAVAARLDDLFFRPD